MTTPKPRSKLLLWAWWIGKGSLLGLLLYLAIIVVGLIPVNNDFQPTEDGVEIFVISSAVHADIIVPLSTEEVDWSRELDPAWFPADVSRYSHLAIGWGNREFFLKTRTWADFKLTTAAGALFLPSRTCLHVDFTQPEYYTEAASVKISHDQYRRLVAFIKATFQRDAAGRVVPIPGHSYTQTDAFFEAHGHYHLFNTCNSWVGHALRTTGIRTPWQSTLPKTPMLYLPD